LWGCDWCDWLLAWDWCDWLLAWDWYDWLLAWDWYDWLALRSLRVLILSVVFLGENSCSAASGLTAGCLVVDLLKLDVSDKVSFFDGNAVVVTRGLVASAASLVGCLSLEMSNSLSAEIRILIVVGIDQIARVESLAV
jgi:hypothetical protein